MVSIVLSTYNRAHMLGETLDSILAQTYRDFELLVIDDGSTDSTRELLAQYRDERIRVIPLEENHYYCAAANLGIRQTAGDYVAFATSDDPWAPDKLELQMEYLEARKECGACFTFSDVIDEEGNPAGDQFEMISGLLMRNFHTRKEWIQHFIFEGNCLCHPSSVVRREVLERTGGFNLLYCQSADLDMWLRIVRKEPVHVIEKNLVHFRCYRNPASQISGAEELKAARFLNEHMIIRRKFINSLSDEEMTEFFGDCFRNPDAAGHREMEIEKAFLLMNCAKGLPDFRILGIEKFEELLQDEENVRILKEKYQVRLQDIYQWNLGHFYMDFGIHVRLAGQDRKVLRLQEEQRKDRLYLEALQRYRNTLTEQVKDREGRTRELEKTMEEERKAWEKKLEETEESRDRMQEKYLETEGILRMKEKELREQEKEKEQTEILLEEALLGNLKEEEGRKKTYRRFWKG